MHEEFKRKNSHGLEVAPSTAIAVKITQAARDLGKPPITEGIMDPDYFIKVSALVSQFTQEQLEPRLAQYSVRRRQFLREKKIQ
jgi:hypothetical protein